MTGGGSIITVDGMRVTHGFELHCDPDISPNNLEVNFDGNNFHLKQLVKVTCYDDPALNHMPRTAPFDTMIGEGIGWFNNQDDYHVWFKFTDNGEPGKNDYAKIIIKDLAGNIVLKVAGYLHNGNQQAQPENKDPALLQAAVAPAPAEPNGQVLNSPDLLSIVAEAKQQWANAGLTAQQLDQLEALQVDVRDLPGLNLGESSGSRIAVDADAAGYGWFVDPTPGQNEEYLAMPDGSLQATVESDASGRMDLLTVISHEMGHVLGYTHTEDSNDQAELMDARLVAGVRELPMPAEVSYFDADAGSFVKGDPQLAQAEDKKDEFLVVMDEGSNKPRHELYELMLADDKRVASAAPVPQLDETESLVTRLKNLAARMSRKK